MPRRLRTVGARGSLEIPVYVRFQCDMMNRLVESGYRG